MAKLEFFAKSLTSLYEIKFNEFHNSKLAFTFDENIYLDISGKYLITGIDK